MLSASINFINSFCAASSAVVHSSKFAANQCEWYEREARVIKQSEATDRF